MSDMKDKIIKAAQEAFKQRLENSSNVSDNTVNAQKIGKDWRTRCWYLNPDRIRIEEIVHPELNQRIDVWDTHEKCAYEFKVSGKNATTEFYKDIVKIILWNRKRRAIEMIKKLVFITEEKYGRKYLETAMPQAFIDEMATHGLWVKIEYIKTG